MPLKPVEVLFDPALKLPVRWSDQPVDTRLAEFYDFSTSMADGIIILRQLVDEKPGNALYRVLLAYFLGSKEENQNERRVNLEYVITNVRPHGEFEFYYSRAAYMLYELYSKYGETKKAEKMKVLLHKTDRTKRFSKLLD